MMGFGGYGWDNDNWPTCKRCKRPKELLGYPTDFWTCPKCDKPRDPPVDYGEVVARCLPKRKRKY